MFTRMNAYIIQIIETIYNKYYSIILYKDFRYYHPYGSLHHDHIKIISNDIEYYWKGMMMTCDDNMT